MNEYILGSLHNMGMLPQRHFFSLHLLIPLSVSFPFINYSVLLT